MEHTPKWQNKPPKLVKRLTRISELLAKVVEEAAKKEKAKAEHLLLMAKFMTKDKK